MDVNYYKLFARYDGVNDRYLKEMIDVIRWINKQKTRITAISALFLVVALISYFSGYEMIKTASLLFVTLIAGIPIFIKAYQGLRMKAFSKEVIE